MSVFIPPEGAMQFEVTRINPDADPAALGDHLWIVPSTYTNVQYMDGCDCISFYLIIHAEKFRGLEGRSWVCKCMGRIIE